jgi:hypothetical protein
MHLDIRRWFFWILGRLCELEKQQYNKLDMISDRPFDGQLSNNERIEVLGFGGVYRS